MFKIQNNGRKPDSVKRDQGEAPFKICSPIKTMSVSAKQTNQPTFSELLKLAKDL